MDRNVLLWFCTMYLYKAAFSESMVAKSKYKSTWKNVEDMPRPVLANDLPRFNSLSENLKSNVCH